MSYLVNKKLYLFKMLKSREKYDYMRKLQDNFNAIV